MNCSEEQVVWLNLVPRDQAILPHQFMFVEHSYGPLAGNPLYHRIGKNLVREKASSGTRTQDRSLTRRLLYQLS